MAVSPVKPILSPNSNILPSIKTTSSGTLSSEPAFILDIANSQSLCVGLAAFPVLSNLAASTSADGTDLADDNGDVIPGLEIVTTYNISEAIPPPLTSLTTLTTSSTLESVFNEPVMSVAVADCAAENDL